MHHTFRHFNRPTPVTPHPLPPLFPLAAPHRAVAGILCLALRHGRAGLAGCCQSDRPSSRGAAPGGGRRRQPGAPPAVMAGRPDGVRGYRQLGRGRLGMNPLAVAATCVFVRVRALGPKGLEHESFEQKPFAQLPFQAGLNQLFVVGGAPHLDPVKLSLWTCMSLLKIIPNWFLPCLPACPPARPAASAPSMVALCCESVRGWFRPNQQSR